MNLLIIFKSLVILLSILGIKQKIWTRSVSTFIMVLALSVWAVTEHYIHEYSLVSVMLGLIYIYMRAMFKKEGESWYIGGVHHA